MIKKTLMTLALALVLMPAVAYAANDDKPSTSKSKGKKPAAQAKSAAKPGTAKPRTARPRMALPSTSAPGTRATDRREHRFRRGLAHRNPESTRALKSGVYTQRDRLNRRGAHVRGPVHRSVAPNRSALQHRGDVSRLRHQRNRVHTQLGRMGSPSAARAAASGSKAGASTGKTRAATSRQAKPKSGVPKGAKPKAPPKKK
jgi:hypothetical protein